MGTQRKGCNRGLHILLESCLGIYIFNQNESWTIGCGLYKSRIGNSCVKKPRTRDSGFIDHKLG